MKRYYYLLLLGVGLTGTIKPNREILNQALAEHLVDYSDAAQLAKEDLGGLFLAQDAQDPRRIQVRSVNQSSTGNEAELRGASCGYHALRNGTLSALSLINNRSAGSMLNKISSQSHANELFGTKASPWRIEISRLRSESTARKVFREMVFNGLKLDGEGANKEFDFLVRCTGDITVPILARPAVWEDGFHYSATKKDIYAALMERCQKLATQGNQEQKNMGKALNSKIALDKYFTPTNFSLDFTIDFEGTCTHAQAPHKVLARVPGDKYGNWVQTDEMPTLVNAQRDSGFLSDEPTLLVATYGEDLGGLENHAFATEQFMKLHALIRQTDNDCVGVVLVYLPSGTSSKTSKSSLVGKMLSWFGSWIFSQNKSFAHDAKEIQSVQDSGHWIALVVSRIKGDQRYYVLDSLSNANRLRNAQVNEIIDILDGKKSLAGYSWTAQQVSKQSSGLAKTKPGQARSAGKPQLKLDTNQGYTWSQIGLGSLATGLITYAAWSIYKDQKNKKNK